MSNADKAKENARTLLQARNILSDWKDIVGSQDEDTSASEEELQEAIDAVKEAHECVADLYPHLAVHAAMLDVADRQGMDTGLDPKDDRSFL